MDFSFNNSLIIAWIKRGGTTQDSYNTITYPITINKTVYIGDSSGHNSVDTSKIKSSCGYRIGYFTSTTAVLIQDTYGDAAGLVIIIGF